tara:strand:+ start:15719 stop:15997 length:279 start_codon:yes stop_codon:yes gene_type:complete
MATDTIVFSTLAVASTSTTFGASTTGYALTFITIINNGTNAITIFQGSDSFVGSMSLTGGQGITFEASGNETLPEIKITTGSGTTSVSVAHN